MKAGYIFCLSAAFFFGITPTMLTLLINSGVSQNSATAYFPFLIMAATVCICAARHISLLIPMRKTAELLLIGVVGMGITQTLLAIAYMHIPVGMATVLHFLYPTVVTVVSMLLFRKKGGKNTAAAIICSIAGMILVSVIGGRASGDAKGFIFALLSSLTYSFYIIGNDGLFDMSGVHYAVSLTYISMGSFLLQIIKAVILDGAFILPQTGQQWLYAMLYAVPMAMAFFLLNKGISQIGAVAASFATLFEPITSVITSTIVFHNRLSVCTVIGVLLILFSVYLNSSDAKG